MKRTILAASMLLVCTSLFAQMPPMPPDSAPARPPRPANGPTPPPQPPMPPGGPGHDPIEDQLFPPDLIMRNQSQLQLSDQQRATLRTEITRLQSKIFDLQWQVGDEADRMAKMLRATPIDEAKVLEQSDKVMALEREIKRLHLSTLIRIKNLLTAEQIAKLQEMRPRTPRPPDR
jgi:Spy/CpxP family protein refolding chaperone